MDGGHGRGRKKRSLRGNGPAVAFLLFGVCILVMAAIVGSITLAILGVGYLINAVQRFFGVGDRAQERRRKRLEARYATQAIPTQPESPPRWFSPDNPPGWYLHPVTDELAYWSELGWRNPPPTQEPSLISAAG